MATKSNAKVIESTFYTSYIEHNLFFFIIFFVLIIFLLYKYAMKEECEDFRSTFNPTIPVTKQQSFSHYLGDEIPLNINGQFLQRNQVFDDDCIKLEMPEIKEPPFHGCDYNGLVNTYENTTDHEFEHPYNWPNNYNTTTGEAVDFMTSRNKQSLDDLAKIIFNDDKELSKQDIFETQYKNNYGSFCKAKTYDKHHIDKPYS